MGVSLSLPVLVLSRLGKQGTESSEQPHAAALGGAWPTAGGLVHAASGRLVLGAQAAIKRPFKQQVRL